MAEIKYLDFEIEISPGAGREYPVAVVHSPAGEARATMKFPFDDLALKERLQNLQIALLRSGGKRRSFLSQEEQTVQEFGQALFNALLTGEVRSRYDVSQREAAQRGLGLRFKLRIQSPELAALPWEFLYDAHQAEYVCLSRSTPVVRYLELPQIIQPLAVTPPLRILGMMASPSDLQPLDLDNEKHRVEEATKDLQKKGLVELTWLEGKTWRDLQKAMRAGPWHVFHFIGHGAFDRNAGEGLIFLEEEDGESYRLSATQLGRLLADHHSLRLALLNACDGARGSARDIFSSTGAILIRRGLPAVLAMQYEITDGAAVEFSRSFYEALAENIPVDAAVVEARKAISLAGNNTVEWGTPVLYMRAPDGKIFDIERQRRPVKPERVQAKPTAAPPRVGNESKPVATVVPPPEIKPRRSSQRSIMISAIALGLIVLTYLIVKNWPVSPESTTPADMVLIPAGSFMMGSNDHDNEKPPHQVYVDEFYLDKYEVTVARYQQFLAANPSQAQPDNWNEQRENSNRPVVYVSWDEAMAYCEWLSRQRRKRVRLPTEAEWEYAARGGLSGKQYPWGDESPDGKANFGNSYASAWSAGAGHCLKNVDSFQANGYGLFNMAGNVWEWCADWYDKDYYQSSLLRNPQGPTSRPSRVLRGGSWLNDPDFLRCAYRYNIAPSTRYDGIGFRCAQDVR